MKPLGQFPITFPSKTKEWFGKGIRMWWEPREPNKTREKELAKREMAAELQGQQKKGGYYPPFFIFLYTFLEVVL